MHPHEVESETSFIPKWEGLFFSARKSLLKNSLIGIAATAGLCFSLQPGRPILALFFLLLALYYFGKALSKLFFLANTCAPRSLRLQRTIQDTPQRQSDILKMTSKKQLPFRSRGQTFLLYWAFTSPFMISIVATIVMFADNLGINPSQAVIAPKIVSGCFMLLAGFLLDRSYKRSNELPIGQFEKKEKTYS